jgi:hypothetical protein
MTDSNVLRYPSLTGLPTLRTSLGVSRPLPHPFNTTSSSTSISLTPSSYSTGLGVFDSSLTTYNTFSRHNSIYASLNTPTNSTIQSRGRKDLLEFQDRMSDILENDSETCMIEEMQVLGVDDEDIDDLKSINKYVTKGRANLLRHLSEHAECERKSQTLAKRIDDTKEALHVIRYKLFSLEDSHETFKDFSQEVIDKLSEKETSALQDLQSEQGILEIRKDKLECIIKYLLETYNILKSTNTIHMCPICLTNEVDAFIDPCGHTLCTQCSKISFCHMCRTKVKVVKNIYFS